MLVCTLTYRHQVLVCLPCGYRGSPLESMSENRSQDVIKALAVSDLPTAMPSHLVAPFPCLTSGSHPCDLFYGLGKQLCLWALSFLSFKQNKHFLFKRLCGLCRCSIQTCSNKPHFYFGAGSNSRAEAIAVTGKSTQKTGQ